VRVTISRTGTPGEDGFEVFAPPSSAERVWDAILHAGKARASSRPASAPATRCASSGDAPLWQRHGRHDDRGRGGPQLDRRLEEGRVPRATTS
jgi:hypothetical protein